MAKLTIKQKKFADEYIISGNATEAAVKAGYSEKTAAVTGCENLIKPNVQEYIENRMQELEDQAIAKQDEVLRYLTSVMRREKTESVVVTLTEETNEWRPDCNGTVRKVTTKKEVPQIVEIPAKLSDANKAAELLGKRYGLFTDKTELSGEMDLNIVVDYGDSDAD